MPGSPDGDARLSAALGPIYDAALDPACWPRALAAVRTQIGASNTALFFLGRNGGGPGFQNVAYSGYPDSALEAYSTYYAARDIRTPPAALLPVGSIYRDGRDLPLQEIEASEIFQDFYRPLDAGLCVGVKLAADDASTGYLSAHKAMGRGEFEAEELLFLERTSPHIVRALQVHRRMSELGRLSAALSAGLDELRTALLLVHPNGRLVQANREAVALLNRPGCPLTLRGGRLGTARAPDASALARALVQAKAALTRTPQEPPAPLRLHGPGTALSLMAVPARPSAAWPLLPEPLLLVFISDPAARAVLEPGLLAAQFGLSPAEAAIAAAIATGQDVNDVADARQVSRETVRAQLKSALAKTGARNQAQLTGLVARSLAAIRRT